MEPPAASGEPVIPAYSAFGRGSADRVYNEAAFRYFLGVDRQRAARSMRSLLLVLITLRRHTGQRTKLNADTAAALFAALGECIRDVDFVGWYRAGYVAGAVLPQPGNASDGVLHRVHERVNDALRQRFPAGPPEALRVRVIRLGAKARG